LGKKPNIVVIGSANIDLIMRVKSFPVPGETLPGGKFSISSGGKGANQAVVLARLGADVSFIGRVGVDPFSNILLQSLQNSGVNIKGVTRDQQNHTGVTVILVDEQGEHTMLPDYGANMYLSPEDLKKSMNSVQRADIILLQCEVKDEVNMYAVKIARALGIPVVINPAPVVPSHIDMLKECFLLTPNLTEVEALAELAGWSPPQSLTPLQRALNAAMVLIDCGVRRIVVTLGNLGSILLEGKQKKAYGTFNVKQVDVTGAGDAFTGGLVFGLASGQNLDSAVTLASVTAALSVSKMGAQLSFPTMEEVKRFMESHTMGKPPEV